MVALDAMDEVLHNRSFTGHKGKVTINVEGMKAGEVGFNCLRLEASHTEGGGPVHDRMLRGQEHAAIGIPVCQVEGNKVEEVLLACAVRAPSAGCETMSEIEGCLSRDERVCLIPQRWGISGQDLHSKCGAS